MQSLGFRMAALAVISGLSGCGGASGGASFDSLFDQRSAQFDDVRGATYFAARDLPNSGSVNYQGFVFAGTVIQSENVVTDAVIGELTINADFNSQIISGSATNFRSEGNAPLTGTLVVQDAGLSRAANDYAFAASMNGNLTQKDGAVREVNSALYGNFFGTNGEIINGDVVGSYTLNGDTRRFDGDFTGVEE